MNNLPVVRSMKNLEPGTIVGPNRMGEVLYVLTSDSRGTVFAYATEEHIADALRYMRNGGSPRSLTEINLWRNANLAAAVRQARQN